MKERQIKNIESDLLNPLFAYFVENGLENISIREICRNVNVSSGSLYYWFKGKDEIVYATITHGLSVTVRKIFEYANREIANVDRFFDNLIDEVNACKREFRLLFQVTTSPVYGKKLRENALALKKIYDDCSGNFASALECSMKIARSFIYTLVSIIVDYVVWEDVDATKEQLEFLKENLKLRIPKLS